MRLPTAKAASSYASNNPYMLLHKKLKSYRLILASHSPRRQQLLRDCGLAYLPADKYEVEE